MVYRRRELWLLLFLAASLGVGLAVREFKAGFPELTERLEGIDAEERSSIAPDTPATPRPALPGSGSLPQRPIKLAEPDVKSDGKLDLNRATPADLQRLPGIGPALAQRIVEARERQGRFASAGDLRRVPGIGEKKFEAIRDLVTVGP